MSKQVIIKAEQLNATHLGKKVTILDDGEAVVSGKLKELRATQYSMPVYSNDIEAVPNGYGSISVVPKTELRNCHRHHHAFVESA